MSTFDFQPTLSGEITLLRPLASSDYEALYDASSDPLIWEQLPRTERYKREVFDAFFDESIALKTSLLVQEKTTLDVLGSTRFARFDPLKSEIEIGWTFLKRRCWGKGFNREAKHLMLGHAFRFVNSVFFVAATTNLRSRRAIEKLGARFEQQLQWPPGAPVQDESALYRLRRTDWLNMT